MMVSMVEIVDTCLNALECLLGWDMIDLLVSTFEVLNWPLTWPGIWMDPSSTSKYSEQSHAVVGNHGHLWDHRAPCWFGRGTSRCTKSR